MPFKEFRFTMDPKENKWRHCSKKLSDHYKSSIMERKQCIDHLHKRHHYLLHGHYLNTGLFPTEIAADEKWPDTKTQGPNGQARLRKYVVVKVPRKVYATIPGRNKYCPSQTTPSPHFTMAGDWTSKFLGSMEGALLSGMLAAMSQ